MFFYSLVGFFNNLLFDKSYEESFLYVVFEDFLWGDVLDIN